MGLFGPSKQEQANVLYELSLKLFWDLSNVLDTRFQAQGIDSASPGPIHKRVRSVVARMGNDIQAMPYSDAMKLVKAPGSWDQFIASKATLAEGEIKASLAKHPPVAPDAKGLDRYGPNHEKVTAFLGRLAEATTDRWLDICTASLGALTLPQAERFRQFKGSAMHSRVLAEQSKSLQDQSAWAGADAAQVTQRVRQQAGERWLGRFPDAATYRRAADAAGRDAEVASEALVVQDALEAAEQSILISGFGPEVMGQAEWARAQQEFQEAQARLGR